MSGANVGWVKVHRRLMDSPIWLNHNLTRFWLWALLRASYQETAVMDGRFKVELLPGQFLYSHEEAASQTGLSQREVRTCIKMLDRQSDIQIDRQKGRQKSILTIISWGSYQDDTGDDDRQSDRQSDRANIRNKKLKKVKKPTGGVAENDPTESPTWKQWVAACRAVGRKDPAPSPGALKAAENLAEWEPELTEQRRIMDAFLTLDDDWVRRQGYQLAVLTKYRIEEARQRADDIDNEPDDLNDPRAIQMALECIAEERARARRMQTEGGTA